MNLQKRLGGGNTSPQDSEEFFTVERDVDLAIYKMDRNVKECESGSIG